MESDDIVFIESPLFKTVISSSQELSHRFLKPIPYGKHKPEHPQNPPLGKSNKLPKQPINEDLLPLLHEKDGVEKTASETGTEDCQHPIILVHSSHAGAGKISIATDQGRGRDAPDEKYPPPAHVLQYCPPKHLQNPHCSDPSAVPPVFSRTLLPRKSLTNFPL
jgi:hypothetical protein